MTDYPANMIPYRRSALLPVGLFDYMAKFRELSHVIKKDCVIITQPLP